MGIKIPFPASLSLGAFLRQAELSIDRAQNISQLKDFFANNPLQSQVILIGLNALLKKDRTLKLVNWKPVFWRSTSILYSTSIRLARFFQKKEIISFRKKDIEAIINVLQSLNDELICAEAPSQNKLNELRVKLNACAKLVLLNINDHQAQSKVKMVEHLNSAPHLITVPIQEISQWVWGYAPLRQ